MKKYILILLVVFYQTATAQEVNILAPTPPMGWNSWNWFGKMGINEDNIRECIDAVVDEGLLDAGYEYFVIDGGWRDTKLDENGGLLANPDRFPHGIKVLADYAHARGLKFGLHTVPGTHDCAGDKVGGLGFEEVHVKQFVDWGIDFIKLDKCKNDNGWDEEILKSTYEKWHRLLKNSGRDIALSISAYKWRDWYPEIGQMARTTGDINAKVTGGAVFEGAPYSVMDVSYKNNELARFAGKGYWNDPDMMVTGNQGLNVEEQKAHFALWCIMSSPLFLGNDPRNMTREEKGLVTNAMAISVNQDPTGQGRKIKTEGKTEVWVKKLEKGSLAVLLLNLDSQNSHQLSISLKELGVRRKAIIQDIYNGEHIKPVSGSISEELNPHSCSFLLVSNPD